MATSNQAKKRKFKLNERTPVLTRYDTPVPEGYIGMYSILRNPLNKAVYLPEEACQDLRQKTFDAILDLCKQYNTPNFAKLFNYNAQVIGEVGLNYFAQRKELAPVVGIMQCFERIKKYDNKNVYISFAINKNLLNQYFDTGVCPVIKWSERETRDAIIFGKKELQLYANKTVKVARAPLFRRFERWCKQKNLTLEKGIMIAVDAAMRKYPVSKGDFLEEYEPITVMDRPLFDEAMRSGKEKKFVEFSSLIVSQAEKIIERWNRDPENQSKKRMDFSTYCNNALSLLNQSMPEKSADPKLFYDDLKSKAKPDKNL